MSSTQRARPLHQQLSNPLEALRHHEEADHYQCGDYLSRAREQSDTTIAVQAECRAKMIDWAFKVCTFMRFGDETVIHAFCILDKFLLTERGAQVLTSEQQFKLAAMTCLYMVAKLQEHSVLSSRLMSALSHGLYPAKKVEAMELEILVAMGWHVHPPTMLMFAMEFLNLLPNSVPQDLKDAAYDLCKIQSCQAVLDYRFVTTKASTLGYFSVLNAFKSLGMDSIWMDHAESLFCYAYRIDFGCIENKGKAQGVLYEAISNNPCRGNETPCTPTSSPTDKSSGKPFHGLPSVDASPCGVAQ